MTTIELLWVAFIIYLMVMVLSYLAHTKWLIMIAGILWLIPIFEIDNVFIKIISATLMIVHFGYGLMTKNESEW